MEDTAVKYFNHDSFVNLIEHLEDVELYLASSYENLKKAQDLMLADEVWKNMGKDETIGFLNIIVQMHRDLSGTFSTDINGVVPNMIRSLKRYVVNMEEFYINSEAYKHMINKTY